MFAPSAHLPRTELPLEYRTIPSSLDDSGRFALLVGSLGFFSLIPYMGIPVGDQTALQVGHFLAALICAGLLFVSWRNRPFWIYPLMIAPLCLSVLRVSVEGNGDASLGLKSLLVWMTSLVPLLAVQLCAPRYLLAFLTGAACATLLHFAVGLWQLMVFASGEFPLLWLYYNPSFLSVQDNAVTIARYQRRPFGIFPEPSAMSSSLAPWVLLWMANLLGLVRFRLTPERWQRILFACAAAGGLSLIIFSQSGHAAITLLAAAVFIATWFVRSKATSGTYATILLMFGVITPFMLWMAITSLANRVGGSEMGNSSWEDRSQSLLIGLNLWLDTGVANAICGFGLGLTSPVLSREYQLEAVWSVLLTYVYETGLIGVVAVGCVAMHLVRCWRKSGYSAAFAAITMVWLVGVTITTSYLQLLSLWMTLGWLSIWPEVCRAPGSLPVAVAERVVAHQPRVRRSAWRADDAARPAPATTANSGNARRRWSEGE
ncbi:MAG TPA: hypothetical protein VGN72_11440 [Tepidisphaeraceae bacterium]|jgi:hypothetical protein|nr:hypothetical protein [Tepidisphaeraceae bacterium]